jgi:hypothetical protein
VQQLDYQYTHKLTGFSINLVQFAILDLSPSMHLQEHLILYELQYTNKITGHARTSVQSQDH